MVPSFFALCFCILNTHLLFEFQLSGQLAFEDVPGTCAATFFFMIASSFSIVLLVGDLFHPHDVFAVEGSRDGDMRHCGGG